eukprot:365154-Chlamydomonas_euryale.AAC.8
MCVCLGGRGVPRCSAAAPGVGGRGGRVPRCGRIPIPRRWNPNLWILELQPVVSAGWMYVNV